MQRERNRLIAEALAAPPPEPAQCTLRALHLGGAPFIRVQLRVPAEGHLNRCHIRTAHDVARAQTGATSGVAYHSALSAEYSRLQDEQPWYWDQLWPGGVALAHFVVSRPELFKDQRCLEFGTGLGLVAACGALAGAACVVATDIEAKALAFADQTAADNGVDGRVRTAAWNWHEPPPEAEVTSQAPFDVVLMPDVMYDSDAVERLGVLAPSLVAPGGLLIWADGTDRPYGEDHSDRLSELVLAAPTPRFALRSRTEMRAGASAEDGGAAPDRPVRLVVMERAGCATCSLTADGLLVLRYADVGVGASSCSGEHPASGDSPAGGGTAWEFVAADAAT